jgi:hypothetical protein
LLGNVAENLATEAELNLTQSVLLGGIAVLTLGVPQASAAIYGFTCISPGSGNCAVGTGGQLTVDVTATTIGSTNAVSFLFRNAGPVDSVITNIYWDDRQGATNTANQYFNYGTNAVGGGLSQGVSYVSTLSSGGTLPRGSNLSPAFSSDVFAQPNPSPTQNGVQEGVGSGADQLEVRIALLNSRTFNDVLNGIGNGTLRLGLHLQGLNCSDLTPCVSSDAYVIQGSPVPEPSAYAVLGLGLSVAFWSHRRKLRKNASSSDRS